MNVCLDEAASAQETEGIRENHSTILEGCKDFEGISSSKKENKFECDKVAKLSIAEDYAQLYNPNIPDKNNVTEEINSTVRVKAEEKYHRAIEEVTLTETDASNQMHRNHRETFKTIIAVDESTLVRFRNNFFEVIEELRIQRILEEENEERIKCLMTEKHDLERRKEEEILRNSALNEQHAQQEIMIKKQQEDRLLQYEEEKAKQSLAAECTGKELKALKDEIRALHLMKYSLEKKIKEQERLIQLQNSARDRHESQMTVLEQRSKKAFDDCSLLADLVHKTESNFSAASHLHRKLMYTNEHQKCLLESHEKELESKKLEHVALKATLSQNKNSSMSDTEEAVNRHSALGRELRMQTEVCRQSLKQLDDSRKEKEKLMESLNEAHKLLDRHVQSINKHNEIEAAAYLELDELKTQNKILLKTVENEQQEKKIMENTLKRDKEEWKQQKQVLESRLADLQKQFDSLSEAHFCLEQLNSSWSERNMEQKAKMELMLKEVDDLRSRLTQAEENFQSQREVNEQLKKTSENETSSLSEKLLQVAQDCKSQTVRANVLKERLESLEKNMKITEKGNAELKSKVTVDVTCQTRVTDDKEVSSLTEKLLNAKEICKSQTERVDDLETQCSFSNEKLDTMSQKIAQLEKEGETIETTTTAVQTDDLFKVNLTQSLNGTCDSGRVIDKDASITEPLGEESRVIQQHEDSTKEEKEVGFIKHTTEAAFKVTEATADFEQDGQSQFLTQEIKQPHFLTYKDNKSGKLGSSRDEILHDTKDSSQLVSSTTKKTAAIPDALSVLPPSNISNDKAKGTNGKKIEVRKSSVKDGNEIMNTKAIIPIGETHVVLPSALFGKENNTIKSKISSSVIAVNEMFDAENRVRSDSEGNKTSPLSESKKKKEEVTEEDSKILFSDEEDGGKECSNIDEDVSRRISRIQNLLRGDRLRTNRKRKHPVV